MTSEAGADDITVILTVWKRASLARQLEALRDQTRPPVEVWIYHCGEHVDPEPVVRAVDWARVNYVRSEHDLGFFGRFALATMVRTPLATVIDDDLIPGPEWLAWATDRHRHYKAVISAQGCILPRRSTDPRNGLYPASLGRVAQDIVVDFGCGSWFFRSEWARAMWSIPPIHLRNAEDMHFAATLSRQGIRTVVPQQARPRRTANLFPALGHDEHAAYLDRQRYAVERNVTLNYLRTAGWRLLMEGERRAPAAP